MGVCGVCGVCAVRIVVRGAVFLLSLWCSPLRCCGAVLCPLCAVCLPCSLPCACPLLGCWLPLVFFVASLLFTALYPFLYSPFSLACTFSLLPPWCVSLSLSSPARLSLSLGPVRQREDGGMWAFGGWVWPPCDVGSTFLAAACSVARHITYLSSHLCLHVCARSSPFAPCHGVLMSLFPYPYLFVCCLSWRRCTPYAKGGVGGGPPSHSSPAPWLVPPLCWSRLFARVGGAWCVLYLHLHHGLVRADTSSFCSFRSLLLSCAERGTTW